MSHSYANILFHCVFSTKERQPLITPGLQSRLYAYIGGIARKNRMKLLAIGGVDDHVHLLLSLSKTMDIAKAMQLIKGGSSKWVHDEFPGMRSFEWQEGYGAFSIGIGEIERTVRYIGNQPDHHQKTSFKSEFMSFIDAHGIEYAPEHLFD